jgi:ferredoxin, 2Fe-2S
MPMVHWILPDGSRISDEVGAGTNLMDAAQFVGVRGIDGECGGCLSCATCHVYVDDAWLAACTPASEVEHAMLDSVNAPRQVNSRLSCQLIACEALNGVQLKVPV